MQYLQLRGGFFSIIVSAGFAETSSKLHFMTPAVKLALIQPRPKQIFFYYIAEIPFS